MPTLYNLQSANIRKTWLLITLFLLLIIGLGWFLSYYFDRIWILVLAVIFSISTCFLSYWYSDKLVIASVRAKPISRKDNPRVYRIVENLCIAAGLPLPKIYIMQERQPNAFATGRNPNNAAIVLTSGLLEIMTDSELEGVISHELSHIKNRDILLSTIIVVFAGIIAIASDLFLRISFWGGFDDDRERGGGYLALLGILAAILAPIAATLIRLAISRKREFLADASGALLTRYPEGLASALEKIAKYPYSMRRASNATAHLFIANPFRGKKTTSWFTKLFMTHPPIEERIKALREMET